MARICSRTIAHGPQRYKITEENRWFVQTFGTFGPEDHGYPRYKWMPIPEDKVPDAVKEAALDKEAGS